MKDVQGPHHHLKAAGVPQLKQIILANFMRINYYSLEIQHLPKLE